MKLYLIFFSSLIFLACGKRSSLFSSSDTKPETESSIENTIDENSPFDSNNPDEKDESAHEEVVQQSDQEGSESIEKPSEEEPPDMPSDTVIAPVSITGANLVQCLVSDKNIISCEFDRAILESQYSKITLYTDGGVMIPHEELRFRSTDSEGRHLEIIVPARYSVESVSAEALSYLNCNSLSGDWVYVPGDSDYNTQDFCLMTFEAKCAQDDGSTCIASSEVPQSKSGGTPWVSIDLLTARSECSSLGQGFHLITNDEWMTVTSLLANVARNWSGGAVGAGNLYRGHSDNDPGMPCQASDNQLNAYLETDCAPKSLSEGEDDENSQRRTLFLSDGQVIWDLAGHVKEWVDHPVITDKPTPNVGNWIEYTEPVVGTSTMPLSKLIPVQKPYWNLAWNSNQGVGRYWSGSRDNGGGMDRGGFWADGQRSGLFLASFWSSPDGSGGGRGFRCVKSLQSP